MNDTTKRDTPFPNSSSTPVSSQKNYDGPNDPNYWKENIITQEESDIKVPITQPGNLLTEFAERLIALEQENVVLREELEQLKEVVRLKILKNEDGGDIMTPKDESSTKISNILRKYNLSTDELKDVAAFALPDIKIGEFTVEDFDEAAKIFSKHNLYTDVINQFVDEKAKEVDKIVFDCFQQYLGCKNADDVFVILTSPVMFHHYNDILRYINEKLAREVGPLGSPPRVIKLGEMTEPATGSHEMLETLRTRWEEIYHEN